MKMPKMAKMVKMPRTGTIRGSMPSARTAMFATTCLLTVASSACTSSGSDGGSGGSHVMGEGGAGAVGSGGTAGGTATGGQSGGTGGGTGGVSATGGTAGGVGGGRGGTGVGGGSTGTGGSAPDGGVASPVTPTKAGTKYQFAFGDVVFEIDPQTGGRVSKLALGGTDLIVPSGTDPTTWGSVFWTSPRSDWTPTTNDWPPPAAIDNAAYTGSISGNHVVVTGGTDPTLGVSMAKDYAADASGWITINYTIKATKALKAAPWEISRVPRGGIVFFPVGTGPLTAGPLTVTQSGGIAWFIDNASPLVTSPNGDKCYGDGAGWTAYVLGDNLFLKKFADQPASAQAPGEGEVDVYPGNGFLEFEVEGPYTSIAASGSLPWSIQWRAVKVPSSVTIAVGSTSLVDFARQQLEP